MKHYLLLLVAILFSEQQLLAQTRLSGTADRTASNLSGSRYTRVDWQISYRFEVQGSKARLVFSNARVTVNATSGYFDGSSRTYSKSELGLGSWPNSSLRTCNMTVRVQVRHKGKVEDAIGSNCGCGGTCFTDEGGHVASTYDLDDAGGMPQVVSVTEMVYNDTPDDAVDRLIEAKGRGGTAAGENPLANSSGRGNSSSSRPPADNSSNAGARNSADVSQRQQAGKDAEAMRGFQAGQANMVERFAHPPQPTLNSTGDNIAAVTNALLPFITEIGAEGQRRRVEEAQLREAESKRKEAALRERIAEGAALRKRRLPQAEAGDPNAMFDVGMSYYHSDKAQMNVWLEKAATNGYTLGYRWLFLGNNEAGADRFTANDVKWLTLAAEHGDEFAMIHLAQFVFASKISGFFDVPKAITWYTKAADTGGDRAIYELALLLISKDAKKLQDPVRSRKLFELCVTTSKNDTFLQYSLIGLARIYNEGLGVPRDRAKAADYEHQAFVVQQASRN